MSSHTSCYMYHDLCPTVDASYATPETAWRRQLFLMWLFVAQEGVLDDARDFLQEHIDDPFPFVPLA